MPHVSVMPVGRARSEPPVGGFVKFGQLLVTNLNDRANFSDVPIFDMEADIVNQKMRFVLTNQASEYGMSGWQDMENAKTTGDATLGGIGPYLLLTNTSPLEFENEQFSLATEYDTPPTSNIVWWLENMAFAYTVGQITPVFDYALDDSY